MRVHLTCMDSRLLTIPSKTPQPTVLLTGNGCTVAKISHLLSAYSSGDAKKKVGHAALWHGQENTEGQLGASAETYRTILSSAIVTSTMNTSHQGYIERPSC